MSVNSATAIVATEVDGFPTVPVLVTSQYTVSPEAFIVCTIVFLPKVWFTVPDKEPAVIVPVSEVD